MFDKQKKRSARTLAIVLAMCLVFTGMFGTVAFADDPPTNATLQARYDQMKAIADTLDADAFEQASWIKFQDSLSHALSVINDPSPLPAEITVAIAYLEEGYTGLTMRQFLKQLLDLIGDAKAIKASADYLNYPLISRETLESALNTGEAAAANPGSHTDQEYRILWIGLHEAIVALSSAGFDYRSSLTFFVQYAEDMLKPGNVEKYIATAVQNLQTEVAASKTLLAKASATSEELNTQLYRLQVRINQMFEIGNKTDLAEAYNIFSRYNPATYTEESWAVLAGVLAQIDGVLKNNNALPSDITRAFDLLFTAEKQLVYRQGRDPSLNPGGLGNGGIDTFILLQAMSGKYWTGKSIKPTPYIIYNGKRLVRGKDYSLSFGKNTDVGPGTITVKGLGSYQGNQAVTVPFSILPSKVTSVKSTVGKKQARFSWKKVNSRQKITSYVIHYRASGTTKWVQKFVSGKNASVTIKNLKRGKTYQYQVRSCRTVGKERYYSGWSGLKITKKVL